MGKVAGDASQGGAGAQEERRRGEEEGVGGVQVGLVFQLAVMRVVLELHDGLARASPAYVSSTRFIDTR
jgi:hypothetical protein